MKALETSIKTALVELAARCGHADVVIDGNTQVFEHLGLDSFAFAELVLIIEQETGLDPFTRAGQVVHIRTVDDIVRVYSEEARRMGTIE